MCVHEAVLLASCYLLIQLYPQISDFEYVGQVFNAICQEVKETILPGTYGEQVSKSRGSGSS